MRLKLTIPKGKPRVEKIRLSAELVERLDHYVAFYQKKLGTSITAEKIMVEMLQSFMQSDRDFMRYYRIHSASNNENAKPQGMKP